MDDRSTQAIVGREALRPVTEGIPRRNLLGLATVALGGLIAAVLAVPGVAYVLSPLRRKGPDAAIHTLTRISQLQVGVPRLFTIIAEREDAAVRYPPEPVGSVWLIRQPAGHEPPVVALQSECPHLGCAVNLKADRSGFLCPCHTSAFTFDGIPTNQVPPRPMDRLDVELTAGDDPEVRVRFQRFRTQIEERIPRV
jgi:menaquinol-cytochrome c reductase iron-sulfur subunit